MKTTLAIDDDVLDAATVIANQSHRTIGDVISDLARRALQHTETRQTRNGIPLLPRRDGAIVTPEIVNGLRDEAP